MRRSAYILYADSSRDRIIVTRQEDGRIRIDIDKYLGQDCRRRDSSGAWNTDEARRIARAILDRVGEE